MKAELFDSKKNAELITADRFMKFLYTFNSPIICPVCKNTLWDVQGSIDIDAVVGEPAHTIVESLNYSQYKKEDDAVIHYPGGLPLFRLTCNTCAYMMLFSYKRVRALIDSQNKGEIGKENNEHEES
ncbi:hypothetical protein WFQ12_21895 [Yersinia enterocolitica]|uniref:hypothetical protein n=1 Tax=Yersinia enterocolitica TaxID=630 RepID=UPI002A14450E|nr:hypothetical protein [Yersinia enterocolitica]EME3611493.1 hypothetical protein [Yersinia enterocolitica]HDL8413692.1 hypothetical protein [Yersinia enterocolitica]